VELTWDLYLTIVLRIAVLFACGGYLFYKWAKAPRRYFFDLPFLIGVSFTALAASKVLDIILYEMLYGVAQENQYIVGHPSMPFAHARWLFMLVVTAPLLYANLHVWVAERGRARLAVVGAHTALFALLILQTNTYAGLSALTPYILLPVAIITVVTFLFAYASKRLPNVHGLLVGLGWAAYLVTSSVRPMLLASGTGTFGLVSVAEILDMLAWLVIFIGFALKPGYAKAVLYPAAKIAPVTI
jgi:hypothetical protein